jgi:UrcA family protein
MTYSTSIRAKIRGRILPVAFAAGAIVLVGARAHADPAQLDPAQLDPVQLDPITVLAPAAKIVDRDAATGAPIEDVTVTARVHADPAALRTHYGALMLNYSVLDAAREACRDVDPLEDDDGICVHDAVESAQPQVDAAIARARSSLEG